MVLVLLLLVVLCMLGCSLELGLTLVFPRSAAAALVLFCMGIVVMGVAMVLAIIEFMLALDPVEMERAALEYEANGEAGM